MIALFRSRACNERYGSQYNLGDVEVDPKAMAHIEAIIQSMTKEERQNPSILNGPRKKRIANGSGRTIAEVNRLLKQFEEMKKMMKQMNSMAKGKKGRMKMPFFQVRYLRKSV